MLTFAWLCASACVCMLAINLRSIKQRIELALARVLDPAIFRE